MNRRRKISKKAPGQKKVMGRRRRVQQKNRESAKLKRKGRSGLDAEEFRKIHKNRIGLVLRKWEKEENRNIPLLVHRILIEKNRNIVSTAAENAMDRLGISDPHKREIIRGLTHSATQSHKAMDSFSLSRAGRTKETARSVRALERELGVKNDRYRQHFGDNRRRMSHPDFQLARLNAVMGTMADEMEKGSLSKTEVNKITDLLQSFGEKAQ
jgi:hypothetical protein